MKSSYCILSIATLVLVVNTSGYAAALKAEDEISYRQSAMMFMRWNMGKIKQQAIENPQHYDKAQVIAAANAINAVAESGLGALFSEKSRTGKGWKKTRVKAEYFNQTQEVRERAQEFRDKAAALVQASQSDDVPLVGKQFKQLFEACKSCHKKFRAKE